MNKSDFKTVCGIMLIDPDVAEGNEEVKAFLNKDKDKPFNVTSQLILTGILADNFQLS